MRSPEFWQDEGPLARALNPLGMLFTAAGRLRRRVIRPAKVAVPVICVGNVTVGGAGKTPTAMALGRRLQAMGLSPHFLTRGYGGKAKGPLRVDPHDHQVCLVGDEAPLLAACAPTWVSRDRVIGAQTAIDAGAEVIIMDDGLQNPHLEQDLSLLVIDGAAGFGNARVLPAGPLREPIDDALDRADAVVLIGDDTAGVVQHLPSHLPRLSAHFMPREKDQPLAGRRIYAFAGIGRPQKFFDMLRRYGADLISTSTFADHHLYTSYQLKILIDKARQFDALCLTTAKDYIRIPDQFHPHIKMLEVDLVWHDPFRLDRILEQITGISTD